MMRQPRRCVALLLASAALVAGSALAAPAAQVPVEARTKAVITVDGLRFRDLDGDGALTPYEDWRLTPAQRADDLLARMTLDEKLGEMLHGTLPGSGGALGRSDTGYDRLALAPLLWVRHITSYISRLALAPAQLAAENNAVREMAEAGRLGIPVTISTDPRNHFQYVAGASVNGSGMSQWPELLGFAALGDPARVTRFAEIARAEYRSLGISMALSPQLDVASDPRWSRTVGTMGSDPALISRLGAAYVAGFQGGEHGLAPGGVLTVAKHWVGYGALPNGFDSHNFYGNTAHLTTQQLDAHVAAFAGALAAGTGAIMPAYPIIAGPVIDGKPTEPVGAGYSKVLVTDLLRGKLGYQGMILSDWAITRDCNQRCSAPSHDAPQRPQDIATDWGVNDLTVAQRYALGIGAGIDQFGGTEDVAPLLAAVRSGAVTKAQVDAAVRRVLITKFVLGLFDDPYVDPAHAAAVVGDPAHHALAEATQREAQVLLTNRHHLLPLRATQRKVWLVGADATAATAAGFTVVQNPAEADVVLIRTTTPSEVLHPDHFFGSRMKEGRLDFRDGDPAFEALKAAKAAGKPAVFAVFLDRPAVLTNVVPLAGAVLANFGASDAAVFDVLTGKMTPRGRLPFELPSSMAAVAAQDPAVPDDTRHPLFKRGAGIVPAAVMPARGF